LTCACNVHILQVYLYVYIHQIHASSGTIRTQWVVHVRCYSYSRALIEFVRKTRLRRRPPAWPPPRWCGEGKVQGWENGRTKRDWNSRDLRGKAFFYFISHRARRSAGENSTRGLSTDGKKVISRSRPHENSCDYNVNITGRPFSYFCVREL